MVWCKRYCRCHLEQRGYHNICCSTDTGQMYIYMSPEETPDNALVSQTTCGSSIKFHLYIRGVLLEMMVTILIHYILWEDTEDSHSWDHSHIYVNSSSSHLSWSLFIILHGYFVGIDLDLLGKMTANIHWSRGFNLCQTYFEYYIMIDIQGMGAWINTNWVKQRMCLFNTYPPMAPWMEVITILNSQILRILLHPSVTKMAIYSRCILLVCVEYIPDADLSHCLLGDYH